MDSKNPKKLPDWLKIRVPKTDTIKMVQGMMRDKHLHTVCESARCPNLPECWTKKTATFMILGNTCTRSCGFCAINVGKGEEVDILEPVKVAKVAKDLNLKHVVVTSVTRDDLSDQGSNQFSKTIHALHKHIPYAIVEVLTPDFKGRYKDIETVIEAHPEIYNHNVETVPRLHTIVRPQAKYERSLDVLKYIKEVDSTIYTKSGLMLGLGETSDEVIGVMKDLRSVGVDAFTLGQYLRPTPKHLPVVEYIHPSVFKEYQTIGEDMGFSFVASGPFIRSSYNAEAFSEKLMKERLLMAQKTPVATG